MTSVTSTGGPLLRLPSPSLLTACLTSLLLLLLLSLMFLAWSNLRTDAAQGAQQGEDAQGVEVKKYVVRFSSETDLCGVEVGAAI